MKINQNLEKLETRFAYGVLLFATLYFAGQVIRVL